MKFATLSFICDSEIGHREAMLRRFTSDYLEVYFRDRDYGKDVKEIKIFILLTRTRCGRQFFHVHRPRYYDDFEHVYADGTTIRCKKEFDIEIGFDNELYDSFLAADEEQAKKILARETLKALELLDKLPKKVKDFDKESFKRDVESLYRSHGWIE